jgi:protein-S-isoprenylcysteine O-methyltransferase Ste14
MSDAASANTRGLIQSAISVPIFLVILAVLLFWPAGTLNWARGWTFIVVFGVATVLAIAWIWRVNPGMFVARSRIGAGTKGWDMVIMPLALLSFAAVPLVAGFDDGRFHWLPLPDWVAWLGEIILVVGYAVSIWALAVNRHFEPSVRVQTDRGHTVIDTGPYAVIRHPGYAAGVLMAIGAALALGSLWALIPALLFAAILAYRTLREEETLRAGLPGYIAYTERVGARWLPGIW